MRIKFLILHVLLNSGARIFSEGGGADFDDGEGWRIFSKGGGFPCGTGLSSMDKKFNSNSVKKCRTGGMQDIRDAGQE